MGNPDREGPEQESLVQDSDEYKWKELAFANPPPARARHAALAVGQKVTYPCTRNRYR